MLVTPLKQINILLVDDDDDYYELFSQIVKKVYPQAVITWLTNNTNINDHIRSLHPDVIVLDYYVPLENGVDCLQKIKSNKEWETIPVAIFSFEEDKIEEARKYGANYFVIKQSSYTKLTEGIIAMMKKCCDGEQSANGFEVF